MTCFSLKNSVLSSLQHAIPVVSFLRLMLAMCSANIVFDFPLQNSERIDTSHRTVGKLLSNSDRNFVHSY